MRKITSKIIDNISHVLIEDGHAVATDSFVLAKVKLSIEKKNGVLTSEQCKIDITDQVTKQPKEDFPDYKQIVPCDERLERKDEYVHVKLNYKKLKSLVEVIEEREKQEGGEYYKGIKFKTFDLFVPQNESKPVVLKTKNVFGLIMPINKESFNKMYK